MSTGSEAFEYGYFVLAFEYGYFVLKQLLFAHSIPGHPRPLGRPHLTWMDTAMHDMGSLGRMLQIDLP